jgi:hypothetical protein
MALQIVVTPEMVASQDAGKRLTFRMRCFREGDPTGPTDPAVIDEVCSAYVDGDLTDAEVRNAMLTKMVLKFQVYLDEFKENDLIKVWLENNGVAIIIAALEG